MTDTLHFLVERYGLLAVLIGCILEGESAAILAGFFAHQHVFSAAGAFIITFSGAFLGDTLIFLAGRRFSAHPQIQRLTHRHGFSRALSQIDRRPAAYVILNRYAYGFRLVGGIAAGLSKIPTAKFVALNAVSSALWAILFLSAGYVFGAGIEQILGEELAKHQRLLAAAGIALLAAFAAFCVHRYARRFTGNPPVQ